MSNLDGNILVGKTFTSRLHGFPEISCSVINDFFNETCQKCLPWFSGFFSESSSSWDSSKNEKIKNAIFNTFLIEWALYTYALLCI